MRYYKIVVGSRMWTSWDGSKSLPGALDVDLDLPVTRYAEPMGAGGVLIKGVSLQDIGQASNFNGQDISIYGGFQKGLPLANATQSGLLLQGTVFQGTGNWQGTNQNIFLVVQPSAGTNDAPLNLTLNWQKGTKLSDALQTTLSTAFPSYALNIDISDKLVFTQDAQEVGYYNSLSQLASYVRDVSQQIVRGMYSGVDIVIKENEIDVYDGSSTSNPTQLDFKDMIGQPTWLSNFQIQVKLAMRADLAVGDYVKFPAAQTTTTPGSTQPGGPSQKSVFQGTFQITQMRHVGSFRQPDADSWVTVIDCASQQAAF